MDLERVQIPEASDIIMDTRPGYQPMAIMRDGSKVQGTFGGTHSPRKRGYYERAK